MPVDDDGLPSPIPNPMPTLDGIVPTIAYKLPEYDNEDDDDNPENWIDGEA